MKPFFTFIVLFGILWPTIFAGSLFDLFNDNDENDEYFRGKRQTVTPAPTTTVATTTPTPIPTTTPAITTTTILDTTTISSTPSTIALRNRIRTLLNQNRNLSTRVRRLQSIFRRNRLLRNRQLRTCRNRIRRLRNQNLRDRRRQNRRLRNLRNRRRRNRQRGNRIRPIRRG